jgi:hypothetical protein
VEYRSPAASRGHRQDRDVERALDEPDPGDRELSQLDADVESEQRERERSRTTCAANWRKKARRCCANPRASDNGAATASEAKYLNKPERFNGRDAGRSQMTIGYRPDSSRWHNGTGSRSGATLANTSL